MFLNYIILWMETQVRVSVQLKFERGRGASESDRQKLSQTFIERYAGFGDFVGNYVYANGSLTPLG